MFYVIYQTTATADLRTAPYSYLADARDFYKTVTEKPFVTSAILMMTNGTIGESYVRG